MGIGGDADERSTGEPRQEAVAAEHRANRAKIADERYRYRVKQVLPAGYRPER
ncbi:hypothetical protein [Haladaptatus salinisoli]|uniref:hypothetical protein n=1 Tax=Haladaptatus salinisoli TaxID=2884876 RepID=UPI001D09A7E7|nr:hypothetical protein [Haladaptatus salinisoli]